MAARRGISARDLFWLSLWVLGSAVLAACQRPALPGALPSPTATLVPMAVNDTAERLPTLTPRPTLPPSATPPTCVQLRAPANGATLPAMGRVTFAWEPMPEAAAYWLEIRLPSGQTATFDSTGSRDLYLEAFPMQGVYYWQVSALGHGGGLLCTSKPFVFHKGK